MPWPRSPGARGEAARQGRFHGLAAGKASPGGCARRPADAEEGVGASRGGVGAGLLSTRLGAALTAAVVLLPAGTAAQQGPYPIFTEAHLDATMATLGPNVAGVRAALDAADYSTAKERAIRSREQLATTITFWRDRDREDAVRWLRTALKRLDALDTVLSVESVDAAAAASIADQIGEACTACHETYREPDGDGRYRVKSSALP